MRPVLVSGPAGAGKSTLGRALAARTGATLLDLDTITNGLLDAVFAAAGLPGHWNDDVHRPWVRPARYAALLALAHEQRSLGHDLVLVAPFTAEVAGGEAWQRVVDAVGAEALLVWLEAPASLLRRRVARRRVARDAADLVRPVTSPTAPHLTVDAARPMPVQVDLVLAHLDPGSGVDGGPGVAP